MSRWRVTLLKMLMMGLGRQLQQAALMDQQESVSGCLALPEKYKLNLGLQGFRGRTPKAAPSSVECCRKNTAMKTCLGLGNQVLSNKLKCQPRQGKSQAQTPSAFALS